MKKVTDFILPYVERNPLADFGREELDELMRMKEEEGGVVMCKPAQERMEQLIDDVRIDQAKSTKAFWMTLVFFIFTIVGAWSNNVYLTLFGLLSLIVALWWWSYSNSLYARITNTHGFIDGMMMNTLMLTREVSETIHNEDDLNHVKQKVEAEIDKLKQSK